MKHVVKKLSAAIVLASLTSPLVAASYSLSPSDDMFYEAGVLYGTAEDNGLSQQDWTETFDGVNTVEVRGLSFNNQPGFTISIGKYLTGDKKHNLVFDYSYLNNSTEDFASGTLMDLTGVLLPNQGAGNDDRQLTAANANVSSRFTFHEFNLLNHNEMTNAMENRVTIQNFYGLGFIHFTKKLNAFYAGGTPGGGVVDLGNITDTVSFEHTSYGIVPKLGIGSEWKINKHLSFGGDLAAGMVIGEKRFNYDESLTSDGGGAFPAAATFHESKKNLVWTTYIVEANLALKADFDFKQQRHLQIKAGLGGKRYIVDGGADKVESFASLAANVPAGANELNFKDSLVYKSWVLSATYTA